MSKQLIVTNGVMVECEGGYTFIPYHVIDSVDNLMQFEKEGNGNHRYILDTDARVDVVRDVRKTDSIDECEMDEKKRLDEESKEIFNELFKDDFE